MIFAAVDVGDVPNLRLTCRSLGEVGLEYLLPEVELLFTLKSFDRLRQISEHPALSRHVKSLVYRIDSLGECADELDRLDRSIPSPRIVRIDSTRYNGAQIHSHVSDRDLRAWRRNEVRESPPVPTKRQLDKMWRKCQTLWHEQQSLRDNEFGRAEIDAIIARLPGLRSIALSNFYDICQEEREGRAQTIAILKDNEEVCAEIIGDEEYLHESGVPQLLSLVRAIECNEMGIGSLSFGLVSWRLFEDEEATDLLIRAAKSLKALRMRITMDDGEEYRCVELFQGGKPQGFLRSLLKLEVLDVSFEYYYEAVRVVDMSSLVGNTQWAILREVSLNLVRTSQHELVDFFERHVETLRVVKLMRIFLKEGNWPEGFGAMRSTLKLRIKGWLKHEGFFPAYDFAYTNRRKVEAYVLRYDGTDIGDASRLCMSNR